MLWLIGRPRYQQTLLFLPLTCGLGAIFWVTSPEFAAHTPGIELALRAWAVVLALATPLLPLWRTPTWRVDERVVILSYSLATILPVIGALALGVPSMLWIGLAILALPPVAGALRHEIAIGR